MSTCNGELLTDSILGNKLTDRTMRVGKKLFEAANNNYYRNHKWSRESFIEGAKWEKKQILESACTAFCKVCDTHECGDYCECCWVENFRKQLKKEMRGY